MKATRNGLLAFLGLIYLILMVNGFHWAFLPAQHLETNSIAITSTQGFNIVKSNIGGPLTAVGIIGLLFLFNRELWFQPLVILTASYLVVRSVSLLVDGVSIMGVVGVAIEAFVLGILFVVR